MNIILYLTLKNKLRMERRIERFDKYMETKGLNDNKVTNQLGFSVGTLGKSRKENRDISDRNIELILNFYTDLNRVWLLTGEGEMINSKENMDCNKNEEVTMSREVFNTISRLTETVLSQQRTIEWMQNNNCEQKSIKNEE